MKITCQSCQSKYNVADEKVQGKIVKIRCRKCGATIVVNGTGGASANGAAAEATAQQGAVGGGDVQWHVNVGDSDQRTLTLSELVDAYNTGVVTQDTFIWCDGMDDWRPLAEVESVVAALHASANQIALGTPGAFEPQGGAAYQAQAQAPAYEPPPPEPAYDPAPAYQAPVAAAAYAAPAEPKRAAVSKREARARDLFATNAGEELQTSAPAAPHAMAPSGGGGTDGMTGQRNENSVLFSLAVLTKNADDRAPVDTGAANREDSGLIDLKALAAKAESMRPPAMLDDGVFHAPLGFAPPLGAPVGALTGGGVDAQPKSKLPLYIGGGAGVLVLLVLGIVIGVKIAGSPAPVPVASVVPLPVLTAAPSAVASAAPTAEPSASEAPSAKVAATPAPKRNWGGGGTYHPPPGRAPTVGGSSGGAAPAPAPKRSGGDCGCNGDLMCLMKCSTH
ncbi:MAG: zinc-ribbon domain-containing protein [Polyangiaceae bacterium]